MSASRSDIIRKSCVGFGLQLFGRNSAREFTESHGTGDNQLLLWPEESDFVSFAIQLNVCNDHEMRQIFHKDLLIDCILVLTIQNQAEHS